MDKVTTSGAPERAVKSLFTWLKKEEKGGGKGSRNLEQLFERDDFVFLTVALKRTQPQRNDKPVRIRIPNPIYSLDNVESCLIVKDAKGDTKKAAKVRLQQQEVCGISKVIGVSKVHSKYPTHEEKRQFCAAYDIFLADNRVLPMLPKLLGKTFFKKKKQPVPVDLRGKDWKKHIEDAIGSTYAHVGSGGNNFTIKVARTTQKRNEVLQNLHEILKRLAEVVPGKGKNVRALYIKSSQSCSLPIFSSAVAAAAPEGGDEGTA